MNKSGVFLCCLILWFSAGAAPVVAAQTSSDHALPTCVPAVSYWPLETGVVGADAQGIPALGSYERISPDGRFVLRSFSGARLGQVSLIELPEDVSSPMRLHQTPLRNEAFPVQGSWRYVVDIDGSHYRLRDLLAFANQAQPLFKAGMRGFYAAASEMAPEPEEPEHLIWIRSMSWPQGGQSGQGTGPLQIQTVGIQDDGEQIRIVHDTGPQFICQGRRVTDGNVYTLPMLSVDGREFSAIPISPRVGRPSMRVYGLHPQPLGATHACDLRWDLQAAPGKAVFGEPGAQTPAMLAYTDNATVYFVDRRPELQGQVFRIDDLHSRVLASAFPGFSRDGRLIFAATWQVCPAQGACTDQAGYVIADPYQNADYRQQLARVGLVPARTCITQADVRAERQRFARDLQLPP